MKKPRKIKLPSPQDIIDPQLVKLTGLGPQLPKKSPEEELSDLFQDVQMSHIYGDGKTFVDLVPTKRIQKIAEEYALERLSPDFNLREFVSRHFYMFGETKGKHYLSDPSSTPIEHINELWKVLRRRNVKDKGSLLALPYTYIAPGGRFREQFYWDSYFIMLGLASEGHYEFIEGMMKNYTHLIRKYGIIPSANRSYFLSRSQPPFFSHMVELLGRKKGRRTALIGYLPYMLAEYRFWMKSDKAFKAGTSPASHRVARMPDGEILNRYFDDKRTARPESYKEDFETLQNAAPQHASRVYLDLRAAAESGWDFSSRWFRKADDISTIHTTDIIPVDLNCLLYHLESLIAEAYSGLLQPFFARKFKTLADKRKKAINKYCWSEEKRYFYDYDFVRTQQTPSLTAAGFYPLFVGIATGKQAEMTAKTMEKNLLKSGGVQTTTKNTGQQWDAPNGWAPLQWIVIKALRNYGHDELADDVKKRWIDTNLQIYNDEFKMVEKYNVDQSHHKAGGGEYPLQDGFGWTNGVLQALLKNEDLQ